MLQASLMEGLASLKSRGIKKDLVEEVCYARVGPAMEVKNKSPFPPWQPGADRQRQTDEIHFEIKQHWRIVIVIPPHRMSPYVTAKIRPHIP